MPLYRKSYFEVFIFVLIFRYLTQYLEKDFFKDLSKMNQANPPVKYDTWCKTDVLESELFTLVWTISKFSSLKEENWESVHSEEFTIKGLGDIISKLFAELYPRGYNADFKDNVSFFWQKAKQGYVYKAKDVHAETVISSLDENMYKRKIHNLDVQKYAEKG